MVNNKKNKNKKNNLKKKTINDELRDEIARRLEVLQIIYQLKQNNLSTDYIPIRELMDKLNDYVIKGEKQEFSIPFPEKNKTIKGYLPLYKNEKCVVLLKQIN